LVEVRPNVESVFPSDVVRVPNTSYRSVRLQELYRGVGAEDRDT